jgi:pentatricopeptide repeat protein
LFSTEPFYNSLIRATAATGDVEQAKLMVSYMRKSHCTPNEDTICNMLRGLQKAGKVEDAIKIVCTTILNFLFFLCVV